MADWLDTQNPVKVAEVIERDGAVLCERYGTDNPRFALWLALVDRHLTRLIGLGHRDIEDWSWRDAFDAETSPREAARTALEDSDLYGPMMAEAMSDG